VTRTPRQSPARAAVARLPPRPRLLDALPSVRSIALGLAVVLLAVLAYAVARETSIFAVRTIEVRGGGSKLDRRVEAALEPLLGTSLIKIHAEAVERLATALPTVAAVDYDRAFPNTLRLRVEPEIPVAVVRHGAGAWLVSRRARVMAEVAQRTHTRLPRIWLAERLGAPVGGTLASGSGAEQVQLLDALRRQALAARIRSVRRIDGQWVYMLLGGLQVRVGDRSDLGLKLAVAGEILRRTPVTGYLDVSVPQRPVATANRQVSG
jgi:cell division septal protein FtsQ